MTNPPPGQTLPAGQSRALDGGASGVQRNPSTGAVERQAPVPQVTRPAGGAPSALFLLLPGGQGGRCNCCSEPQPYSNLISSFMSSNIVAVMHVQVSVQLRTKQLQTKMLSNAFIIDCLKECCPVTASERT